MSDLMWLLGFRHEELLSRSGVYAEMWQQQLTRNDGTNDDENNDSSPNSTAVKNPPPPSTRLPHPNHGQQGQTDHGHSRHGHGHGRNH